MHRLLLFLGLVGVTGCYSPGDIANGKLQCAPNGDCPEGFGCVAGRCWLGGIVVDDMNASMPNDGGDLTNLPDAADNDMTESMTMADMAQPAIACTNDSLCPSEFYCNTGASICVPQVAMDGDCTTDNQCVSNVCYFNKCTPAALHWLQISNFTVSSSYPYAAALPYPDGRVFALDATSSSPTSTVVTYNVSTRAVGTAANLPDSRNVAGVAPDPSGKSFWVFGGWTSVPLSTDYLSFDGSSWHTNTIMMPHGRALHRCATLGTSIYCAGGQDPSDTDNNPPMTSVDYLDSLGWHAAPDLPIGMSRFGLTVAGGKLYAAYLSYFYVLNGSTWSPLKNLDPYRQDFDIATGADGRIYAAGGGDPGDPPQYGYGTVVAYSPALNRWVPLTYSLNSPRSRHSMVTGADGRIYAVGGHHPLAGGDLPIVEVYGPDVALSTNTPAPGATLSVSSTNMGPNAKVRLTLDGSLIAMGTTDSGGKMASVSFPVPTSTSPGDHYLVVVDNRSGYPVTLHLNVQ